MTNSNLTLHCSAFKANRGDLETIATPEATSTWVPIPHAEIVDAVLESATKAGLTIKRELYRLSGKKDSIAYGARMFGVIDFLDGTSDYGRTYALYKLLIMCINGNRTLQAFLNHHLISSDR